MPSTLTKPSYQNLLRLTGSPIDVVDEYATPVQLWVECVSSAATWGGLASFSVRLTGPVGTPLDHGTYLLRSGGQDFLLPLTRVASDVRFLHYEAYVQQPIS